MQNHYVAAIVATGGADVGNLLIQIINLCGQDQIIKSGELSSNSSGSLGLVGLDVPWTTLPSFI
jgi:hypothetical protein